MVFKIETKLRVLDTDPPLAPGAIWIRGGKVRYSPDGATVRTLVDPLDLDAMMDCVVLVNDYVNNQWLCYKPEDFTRVGTGATVTWLKRVVHMVTGSTCVTDGVISTKYNFTNAYIEFVFSGWAEGAKGAPKLTVALRLRDADNWYGLNIDVPATTADFRITRRLGGTFTELAIEAVDLPTSLRTLMKFRTVGSTLEAYRDGVLRLTATDTNFSQGGIGFLRHEPAGMVSSIYMRTEATRRAKARMLGYYEVGLEGTGTPEDPARPALPARIEIVDERELEGYPPELAEAIKANEYRVNRIALSYSAFIPPRAPRAIVRMLEQPDRQPHLWKVEEALAELEKRRGVRKLDRDQAIRRAKELDEKVDESELDETW
jgi:hypothetical protein